PGELVEGGDHGQLAAQLSPDRVALEVPGDVLAQVAHSVELVLEVVDEVLTVLVHGPAHLGQSRTVAFLAAVQGVREVAEEPGPSLAAAADDDSVAAGHGHHLQSVLGGEDIAVAQYGHSVAEVVLEPGDRVPVGLARVQVRGRAPVQGDGGDTGVAGRL